MEARLAAMRGMLFVYFLLSVLLLCILLGFRSFGGRHGLGSLLGLLGLFAFIFVAWVLIFLNK